MDQRQDRVADDFGFSTELVEIDPDRFGGSLDGLRGFLRHNAETGLGAGQRDFGLDVAADQGFVGEDRPHFRGAEHVSKQDRIENRAAHNASSYYVRTY